MLPVLVLVPGGGDLLIELDLSLPPGPRLDGLEDVAEAVLQHPARHLPLRTVLNLE